LARTARCINCFMKEAIEDLSVSWYLQYKCEIQSTLILEPSYQCTPTKWGRQSTLEGSMIARILECPG
jgi:hypothetical protein